MMYVEDWKRLFTFAAGTIRPLSVIDPRLISVSGIF